MFVSNLKQTVISMEKYLIHSQANSSTFGPYGQSNINSICCLDASSQMAKNQSQITK